jgi:hypothetical protein
MANPMTSVQFADLLLPDFRKVFYEAYASLPSMLGELFSFDSSTKAVEKDSAVGTLPDYQQFLGTVNYSSMSQGYDVNYTHLEWTNGAQVERKLFDDDQYRIMNQRPEAMGHSAARTRETHGARIFNNHTSVDTLFFENSDGVALSSNSHTTTSGASTSSGFDNLLTTALSATSLATAVIQMQGFRGDQAERIEVAPDTILIPPNLYETAYEIVKSMGKVDTAQNNANVHFGQYKVIVWKYLTDTNDWFLIDSREMARRLVWFERIPLEFAQIEDFDTLIAKYRGYMRYSLGWSDWRWILGNAVS